MGRIMSRLSKMFEKNNDENDKLDILFQTDTEINNENAEESPFPISKQKAKEIAQRNNTLKTDFTRNSKREGITFIGLYNATVELIEKNEKKYWQYEVLSGDISWMEFDERGDTFCDGGLTEEDLKLLRCLIDVETGDYTYYPKIERFKDRGTIKFEGQKEHYTYNGFSRAVRNLFNDE